MSCLGSKTISQWNNVTLLSLKHSWSLQAEDSWVKIASYIFFKMSTNERETLKILKPLSKAIITGITVAENITE